MYAPEGLENHYQIDIKSHDRAGNTHISSNLWRGMIDTLPPRVVMEATPTGASYLNSDMIRYYEVRFLCAAQDRNLDEAAFECPGEGVAEPERNFDNLAALQTLFPDLTLRTGLAISYTLWTHLLPLSTPVTPLDTAPTSTRVRSSKSQPKMSSGCRARQRAVKRVAS
jgi:hypothetical protein